MLMYNLFVYSDNYSMTSRSLQNYYREGINDYENENDNANNRINNKKTIISKSFEYKTKLIGNRQNDNNILKAEVLLKFCSVNIFE